jgi:DNA-binding protein H-NS
MNMSSKIQELIKQKEELERAISEERTRHRVEGLEKVKAIIEEYDLQISDVFPNQINKVKLISSFGKNKVTPKYRNPENGSTWTGRGKEPLWISGKDRSLFLI